MNKDENPKAETRNRDVNERAKEEQRAWQGDEDATRRRTSDEAFKDPRGYAMDRDANTAGLGEDERIDAVRPVPEAVERAKEES